MANCMCPHSVQQPIPIYIITWGIIPENHLGEEYGPKTAKTSKCTKFMQIDLITILKKKHILYVVFWGGKWKSHQSCNNLFRLGLGPYHSNEWMRFYMLLTIGKFERRIPQNYHDGFQKREGLRGIFQKVDGNITGLLSFRYVAANIFSKIIPNLYRQIKFCGDRAVSGAVRLLEIISFCRPA